MKIGIDPGHGGLDPGSIGPTGLKEKDVTLPVSMLVLGELQRCGFYVVPTRTTDIGMTLFDRSRMFDAAKVDLAVSIHVNSSDSQTANYVANFIVARGGKAEKAAKLIQEELMLATGWPKPDTIDGVKVENLHMVREPDAPAVIVEMGFTSNPAQEKQLREPAFHCVLAVAIAKGICKHFGVAYKPAEAPKPASNEVKVVAGDKIYSGKLIDGKTYVHVRVLEEFGLPVFWEDTTRTVYVGDRLPRLEQFGTYDVITARADQLKVSLVRGHLQQDGINGGYLDGNLNPLGITIIDGRVISDAVSGKPSRSVFVIGQDGTCSIIPKVQNIAYLGIAPGPTHALGAGPGLLPVMNEGFADDIVKSKRERSAVGITSDGLVKLVATAPMTLEQLSATMAGLGCIRAMNLDGGGSSHMRFGGKTIRGGGRAISTAIILA